MSDTDRKAAMLRAGAHALNSRASIGNVRQGGEGPWERYLVDSRGFAQLEPIVNAVWEAMLAASGPYDGGEPLTEHQKIVADAIMRRAT